MTVTAEGLELDKEPVVLTALSGEQQAVLVIPEPWVVAELRTFRVLSTASTFRDVREDVAAALLMQNWLPSFVERQEEDEQHPALRGGADHSFDAEEFFGFDHQFVWRPDPVVSTATWLWENEPELADTCLHGDCSGLLALDAKPFVAPGDRLALEADLQGSGRTVRDCPDLAFRYLAPGPGLAGRLRSGHPASTET